MKTFLTTLAAAILALALGGAVQAGTHSGGREPRHTDRQFQHDRDSHWYSYHRERCEYRPYCETPVCDCPVYETPVCETPVCDCPVYETPVCEYPVWDYRHWDSHRRREHPLGRESKEFKSSTSHRK